MLKRIRELRIENGLSEEDVAKVLGVSCKLYCKIEKGAVSIKASQLVDFCKFFNISPDYIFEFIDEKRELPKKWESSNSFNKLNELLLGYSLFNISSALFKASLMFLWKFSLPIRE